MSLIDKVQLNTLSNLFKQIIQRNLSDDAWAWLEKKIALITEEGKSHNGHSLQLDLSFSHLPRFTGKNIVQLEVKEAEEIDQLLPGFQLQDWTIDRLSRVWLLMQFPTTDKAHYLKKINGLFVAAEMNEQVALYSALPFYAYPEEWVTRCEEGIRSNIGTVLEAIMYHNPYPAKFLPQPSWNQLVLKAFFTEKDMSQISGLYKNVNAALAETLQDYVQERLAAHRTVAPEIYKLIEQMNQNK